MPVAASLPTFSLGGTVLALKQKVSGSVPTDARYIDSFGARLSDIVGLGKRWALAGTAQKIWEDTPGGLRQRLDELMSENEGVIYKGYKVRSMPVGRHCWMMGLDIQKARPTVVICCSAPPILKRMMHIINEHKLLRSRGYGLKGVPRSDVRLVTDSPPRDSQLLAATEDSQSRGETSTQIIAFGVDHNYQAAPISLCGLEIKTDQNRSATIGGGIILDGQYHAITVAHAFSEQRQVPSYEHSLDEDLTVYDSDWADSLSEGSLDEDNSSDYEQLRLDTDANETGGEYIRDSDEPGQYLSNHAREAEDIQEHAEDAGAAVALVRHQSDDDSEDEQLPNDEHVVTVSSSHPWCNDNDGSFDGMDWAIIEVQNPFHQGMNGVLVDQTSRKWLYFKRVETCGPQASVIVATRRGIIRGIGTGSATSIKLRGSSQFRDVWSIQPDTMLDSGAWVVDAAYGNIFGVIVAVSSLLQECYLLPLREIMDDIRQVSNADSLTLPSTDDVLKLASRFRNVNLVESLLAAGADANNLDPDYDGRNPGAPPPRPPPPQFNAPRSSPWKTSGKRWYCGNCSGGGNLNVELDTHCPLCGNKQDQLSRFE